MDEAATGVELDRNCARIVHENARTVASELHGAG